MQIDHVAHICRDPRRTHEFYAGVLGLNLTNTYAGEALMIMYALPGGGSLVFTTGERSMHTPPKDWERQHVGLTVETRAEFDGWLQTLRKHGIECRVLDDERIYFSDPDGLILEIELASTNAPDPAAVEVLEAWLRARHKPPSQ